MSVDKDKEIEYLLNIHSTIQNMVNQTDERGIGATNIVAIIAIMGVLVANLNSETTSIYCILFPIGVLTILSLYTYHNRVSAILRGYLAGIEDILATKIEKNIFIFNKGYVPLYHIPHFITNDIMGLLFVGVGVIGIIYSFYQMFSKSLISPFLIIMYIAICLIFGAIYLYELMTNGNIKNKARTYFHLAYNNDVLEYNIDIIAFENYTKENHIKFDLNISPKNTNNH